MQAVCRGGVNYAAGTGKPGRLQRHRGHPGDAGTRLERAEQPAVGDGLALQMDGLLASSAIMRIASCGAWPWISLLKNT